MQYKFHRSPMIQILFEDSDLEQLFKSGECKKGKYKMISRDKKFVKKLRESIQFISSLDNISELSNYARFNYEALKHNLSGLHSIRVIHSRVERLIFRQNENCIEITFIELNQDHYGNL